MLSTIPGNIKNGKIIPEGNIPIQDERKILLTLLDTPTIEDKDLILAGIQKRITK